MAAVAVFSFSAVCRNLDNVIIQQYCYSAMLDAGWDYGVGGEYLHHLFWCGRGSYIVIVRLNIHHQVSDSTANKKCFVASLFNFIQSEQNVAGDVGTGWLRSS